MLPSQSGYLFGGMPSELRPFVAACKMSDIRRGADRAVALRDARDRVSLPTELDLPPGALQLPTNYGRRTCHSSRGRGMEVPVEDE
jgi:hypothetical protein